MNQPIPGHAFQDFLIHNLDALFLNNKANYQESICHFPIIFAIVSFEYFSPYN